MAKRTSTGKSVHCHVCKDIIHVVRTPGSLLGLEIGEHFPNGPSRPPCGGSGSRVSRKELIPNKALA